MSTLAAAGEAQPLLPRTPSIDSGDSYGAASPSTPSSAASTLAGRDVHLIEPGEIERLRQSVKVNRGARAALFALSVVGVVALLAIKAVAVIFAAPVLIPLGAAYIAVSAVGATGVLAVASYGLYVAINKTFKAFMHSRYFDDCSLPQQLQIAKKNSVVDGYIKVQQARVMDNPALMVPKADVLGSGLEMGRYYFPQIRKPGPDATPDQKEEFRTAVKYLKAFGRNETGQRLLKELVPYLDPSLIPYMPTNELVKALILDVQSRGIDPLNLAAQPTMTQSVERDYPSLPLVRSGEATEEQLEEYQTVLERKFDNDYQRSVFQTTPLGKQVVGLAVRVGGTLAMNHKEGLAEGEALSKVQNLLRREYEAKGLSGDEIDKLLLVVPPFLQMATYHGAHSAIVEQLVAAAEYDGASPTDFGLANARFIPFAESKQMNARVEERDGQTVTIVDIKERYPVSLNKDPEGEMDTTSLGATVNVQVVIGQDGQVLSQSHSVDFCKGFTASGRAKR